MEKIYIYANISDKNLLTNVFRSQEVRMSIIQCPECSHNISDKALACPSCGYPLQPVSFSVKRPRKKHKKLPNGFGSIKKLSGNRRNPYAAYPPTTEFTAPGIPVTMPAIGYYENWYAAFDALREYNHSPYDIRNAGLTFADVYKQWYKIKFESEHSHLSEQSKKTYKWAYNQCSTLHDMKMSDIHKNEMQAVLDSCKLGYSSVRSIKNLFGQMFRYSLENGIVDKDYSQFISISIQDNNERGEPFTEQEISLLWDNKEDPSVQIILILIYSGLRISELEVVEINLKDRCFRGGLKTKAGKERIVPIHKSIYKFVKNFSQKDFHAGTFRDKKFYKLIQEVGMEPLTNGKKHTPHDCRHTFSWLCDKYKVDDMSKHLIMGHSLGRDVEKAVYGHRTFAQLSAEINKIKI